MLSPVSAIARALRSTVSNTNCCSGVRFPRPAMTSSPQLLLLCHCRVCRQHRDLLVGVRGRSEQKCNRRYEKGGRDDALSPDIHGSISLLAFLGVTEKSVARERRVSARAVDRRKGMAGDTPRLQARDALTR